MKIEIMNWLRVMVLLCLGFVVGNCSPSVNRIYLLPERLPPKPVAYPISLYLDKEPECPYQEIGVVTSRQRNKFISMDAVMESIRKEARKMGGDAVIRVSFGDKPMGAVVPGRVVVVDYDPVVNGTVIRWIQQDCTK
jgi:hypothetical protein